MLANYYMDIDFTASEALTMDRVEDLCDAMKEYYPAVGVSRDQRAGSVALCIEAKNVPSAMARLDDLLEDIQSVIGKVQVTSAVAVDEATREAENEKPVFPELVTISEIAELAGITRQRAAQIVRKKTFPVVIAKTGSSLLYDKAAVLRWIEIWPRTNGRPPRK